jgi:hypothetical protein
MPSARRRSQTRGLPRGLRPLRRRIFLGSIVTVGLSTPAFPS